MMSLVHFNLTILIGEWEIKVSFSTYGWHEHFEDKGLRILAL